MKKLVGVVLLVALAMGTWTPMVQADKITVTDVTGAILPALSAINDIANNGPKLPEKAKDLSAQLKQSKLDIQADLATLKRLKPGVPGSTKEQQNEAMVKFLKDLGVPFEQISLFVNNVNKDILQNSFKFLEAIPKLQPLLLVKTKDASGNDIQVPLSQFMTLILGALQYYTDTYKDIMQRLPKLMEAPTAGTATPGAAAQEPAVDLGF